MSGPTLRERDARVIAEIPVGDIVGEMSLIGHRRRSHTIAAIRDSEVLRLTRSEFERVCADHPQPLMGLLAKVVERYGSPPRPDLRPPRNIALLIKGGVPPPALRSPVFARAPAGDGKYWRYVNQ